ncbi:MAG: rRNA pseudouridine synthase, partial [Actinobacteria bacterium]|nr:rRNA pseudouridine synthase [Actinomycetota bacterium]
MVSSSRARRGSGSGRDFGAFDDAFDDTDDFGGDLGGHFEVDVDGGFGSVPEGTAGGAAGAAGTGEGSGPAALPRLQKVLANAGVASRRACEALIAGGRVEVNGEIVFEMGSRIDPENDEVRVDGVIVQLDVGKRYFVLNKPRGVVSTMSDENGRPDLREFTDRIDDRLYNVGRLDTDTSGLLVLTNDGELAHKLAHPKFGVQKTYIAKVRGRVTPAVIQSLKNGIELEDGPIRVDAAKLLPGGTSRSHSLVEVTLHSGRNRIVRRMLAAVGHPG